MAVPEAAAAARVIDAVGALRQKIISRWRDVEKIVIIGGKPYVEAYRILCKHLLPETETVMYDGRGHKSPALLGFLEILRLSFKNKMK